MKQNFKGKIVFKIIGEGLATLVTAVVSLAIIIFILSYSSMLIWNKVFSPVTGFGLITLKQSLALGMYLCILKIWFTAKRSKKDEQ